MQNLETCRRIHSRNQDNWRRSQFLIAERKSSEAERHRKVFSKSVPSFEAADNRREETAASPSPAGCT